MAISEELKQHLMDLADETGADPAELIAEVESQMSSANTPDAAAGAAPDKAAKMEAGHQMEPYEPYSYPFLKVNEIRACLGLGPVEGGELYAGEWLKKYGGAEFLAATT